MTESGSTPAAPKKPSALGSCEADAIKDPITQDKYDKDRSTAVEPDSAEVIEYEAAWNNFDAADRFDAEAESIRALPQASSVGELQERRREIANLEARAKAVRPPPANTGRPMLEPAAVSSLLQRTGRATGAESPEIRRKRRLQRLTELGGQVKKHGEGWRCGAGRRGALAELVLEEQRASRPMSNKADVSNDLIVASGGEKRGSKRG